LASGEGGRRRKPGRKGGGLHRRVGEKTPPFGRGFALFLDREGYDLRGA